MKSRPLQPWSATLKRLQMGEIQLETVLVGCEEYWLDYPAQSHAAMVLPGAVTGCGQQTGIVWGIAPKKRDWAISQFGCLPVTVVGGTLTTHWSEATANFGAIATGLREVMQNCNAYRCAILSPPETIPIPPSDREANWEETYWEYRHAASGRCAFRWYDTTVGVFAARMDRDAMRSFLLSHFQKYGSTIDIDTAD